MNVYVQQVRKKGHNWRAWKHHGQGFLRGRCATGSGRPLDGRTWARTSPQHGTATREDQVRKVASLDEKMDHLSSVLRESLKHD